MSQFPVVMNYFISLCMLRCSLWIFTGLYLVWTCLHIFFTYHFTKSSMRLSSFENLLPVIGDNILFCHIHQNIKIMHQLWHFECFLLAWLLLHQILLLVRSVVSCGYCMIPWRYKNMFSEIKCRNSTNKNVQVVDNVESFMLSEHTCTSFSWIKWAVPILKAK